MDVAGTANQFRVDTDGGDIATYDGGGGRYKWFCELAQNVQHHIRGWAPHGTIAIPFGKQDVIEDWEDLSGIGNLKLDITDGSADSTTKVFIQQLRRY